MKIRTGFVSNSSSSSFVCDLCGRSQTGYDLTPEEAEMVICVNGHTICISEMMEDLPDLDEVPIGEQKKYLLDYWEEYKEDEIRYYKIKAGEASDKEIFDWFSSIKEDEGRGGYDEIDEKYCPICQMISFANSDLAAYLLKKTGITRDEVFNIVKQANKRRKKLYDNEYVMYVLQKIGTEMSALVEEIRGKFKTYREFKEYSK